MIAAAFARARAEDRAALIGFLPAGFPSRSGCVQAIAAMVAAGVDLVEIGLPYSDPVMDGPVTAAAADRALAAGMTTQGVLDTVSEVARLGVPTLVMTYWNPVQRYGVDRFAADLAAAGGAGVITTDLTPEEAGPWRAACTEYGLDPVMLVAPSSSEARLRLITATCGGFVYAASTMGVTGARAEVSPMARDLVARTQAVTDLPVAVGLGVGTGEQAAAVAGFADGVIVGTAFVRAVTGAEDEAAGSAAAGRLAGELAAGVRRRRPSPRA